jgi:hypothetical protein
MASGSASDHGSAPAAAATALASEPRTAVAAAANLEGCFGVGCREARRAADDRAATFFRAVLAAVRRDVDFLAAVRRDVDFFAAVRRDVDFFTALRRFATLADFADLRVVPRFATFFVRFFVARFANSLLLTAAVIRRVPG